MKFKEYGYQAWKFKKEEVLKVRRRIDRAFNELSTRGISYDAVVLSGTSATWLGALLVLDGHNVILVRKPEERSHGEQIEGTCIPEEIRKVVIIDDLICSGDTINRIKKSLERADPNIEIVGVVLHSQVDRESNTLFKTVPVIGYKESEE